MTSPSATMAAIAAGPGYDEVTGIGTPVANALVPDLATYGITSKLVVSPPSIDLAGNTFSVTVAGEDNLGDINTSFTGTVALSLTSNPGGSTLSGTLTATAVNGVATSPDCPSTTSASATSSRPRRCWARVPSRMRRARLRFLQPRRLLTTRASRPRSAPRTARPYLDLHCPGRRFQLAVRRGTAVPFGRTVRHDDLRLQRQRRSGKILRQHEWQ